MNFPSKLIIIAFVLCSPLIVVGCGTGADTATPAAQSADNAAGEALATVAPAPTATVEDAPTETAVSPSPTLPPQEETTNNVAVTVTPDGTQTETQNLPGTYIITSDDDYYMTVSYAIQEESDELSEDQKRLLVTATLGNESDATITIEDSELSLIDAAGNRYPPNIYATVDMEPALIGTQLGQNENVYGFVGFDVPADATIAYLEWCLSGSTSCERPLHAAIP